jgi:TolB-like protein
MLKKRIIILLFLAIIAKYTVFSQTVAIDAAISNAVNDFSKSVPKGTKIAVLNISSDYSKLSDYIIDELITNLVNTKLFQVVPRSTVELELAKGELDFQYTGNVSDESQKRLGKFLGAGTIVSGTVTRDSVNSYRLMVNAIDLESFTYQSSYRISVQNDNQVKALVTSSGGVFYEDYTTGERLGIGFLNIFGGIGSIMKNESVGLVTTGLEAVGIFTILIGLGIYVPPEPNVNDFEYFGGANNTGYQMQKREYDDAVKEKNNTIIAGSAIIGAGIVFGFVIPFFHHKPNNAAVSEINNQFPFKFELVSSNNRKIDGFKFCYNMKF